MPHVRIEMLKGKNARYKKAVLDGIHMALMDALKIPDNDRNQRIYELENSDFEKGPSKTNQFLVINILLFQGRSVEAKKKLYQTVIEQLGKNPGIKPDDITIILQDIPIENWGFGGKSASDIDFGFKINI